MSKVDWHDGKQSLIKLPEKLYTHFALVAAGKRSAAVTEGTEGLSPEKTAVEADPSSHAASEVDVVELIGKLAALRDQGILSEDEFTAKKADLLSRL